MVRFHQLDWPQRVPLLGQFEDGRYRALGKRLVHAEAPELMSEAARRAYEAAIAKRLMADDGTVPWLTLPKAIEEADELIAVTEPAKVGLLTKLREYLISRAEAAAVLIA